MADIKTPEERSRNMSAIRSKNTKPELYIRKHLFGCGFRYRVCPEYVPGHPDLYLAKYRAAIFIHGCFWHRHADCKYAYMPKTREEFWAKKFGDNERRDGVVRDELQNKGIRQLVVWECAVRSARKKCNDEELLFSAIKDFILSSRQYEEISSSGLYPGKEVNENGMENR